MVQLVWTIPKVDMNGFYGSPGIIPIAHPNKRTNERIELSTKYDRRSKRQRERENNFT